jgi:hypothetical protein
MVFKVNTLFEVLWKIIYFLLLYMFVTVNKSSYDVYCYQVVVVT